MATVYQKQSVEGVANLRAVLAQLPVEMHETVLREVADAGGREIEKIAKRNARKRTGALQKSITRKVVVSKRVPGVAVAIVGPDRNYYSGGKRLKKGASRRGADRPVNYAHLVEFGHHTVKPKKGTTIRNKNATVTGFVPARPFMRPALTAGAAPAAAAMEAGAAKGLEKIRKKLVAQYGHKT